MKATIQKAMKRMRRHNRVRARISGTATRPRLAVFRSNKYLSAQLIDDEAGVTLAQAHGKEFGGSLSEQAKAAGSAIAERAKAKDITTVIFDRGGYLYTGRIKTFADSAREAGLSF